MLAEDATPITIKLLPFGHWCVLHSRFSSTYAGPLQTFDMLRSREKVHFLIWRRNWYSWSQEALHSVQFSNSKEVHDPYVKQSSILHLCSSLSVAFPSQGFPPSDGGGSVHLRYLVRCLIPPPQLSLQLLQSPKEPNELQNPWTIHLTSVPKQSEFVKSHRKNLTNVESTDTLLTQTDKLTPRQLEIDVNRDIFSVGGITHVISSSLTLSLLVCISVPYPL